MTKESILVVGGSSGIGQAVVDQLLKKNYQIYATSRKADIQPQVDSVNWIQWEASDKNFNVSLLPEMLAGLVYCPGTITLKPFHRLTDEDYQKDWEINFLGAVRVIKACLEKLKTHPQGAAIVLFSTVAADTGMPFHASIGSAKAAVEGLTKSLASELAPKIRVNAIAPSLTATSLANFLINNPEKLSAAEERHPLKKIGDPNQIAQIAVQLIDAGFGWMTGQVLHVDGGLSSVRLFN